MTFSCNPTKIQNLLLTILLLLSAAVPALSTPYNIAPQARVEVSSQLDDAHSAACLTDGRVRIPGMGAWQSGSQMQFWGVTPFPWLQLTWDRSVELERVLIYDRPTLDAHIASGVLIFDDGTRLLVDQIPNNGAPREVTFQPRKTRTLRFETNDADGNNLGLSEIEVYPSANEATDYVGLVDPYIETARSRYFFFATGSMPFGQISSAPLTRNKNQGGGGYNYNSTEILGFPQIHAWMMGGLDFMPITGSGQPMEEQQWKSAFSHAGEVVQPAYHRLWLDRYNTWVEQTCTDRVSLYRMTYTEDASAELLLNLGGYCSTTTMTNAHAWRTGSSEIQGYFDTTGRLWGGPDVIRVFFVARFDQPFHQLDAWSDGKLTANTDTLIGPKGSTARREGMSYHDAPTAGLRAHYDVHPGQQLQVKMAISYCSIAEAVNNMEQELPGWDFDATRKQSQDEWNRWLGRISVKGGTGEQRVKFYTDLWHVLLGRHKIDDFSGTYPDYTNGERDGHYVHNAQLKVRQVKDKNFHMYNSDSFWLTMWNLNTLWGIAYPDVLDDFAASLVEYSNNGGLLPRGPNIGGYSYIMSGCPATSLIASAYQRGITHKWNPRQALRAMVRNHEKGGMLSIESDDDLSFYEQHGYVPDRGGLTVQWAFEDWALAEMAAAMGQKKIAQRFHQRAAGWQQSFHPQQKLVLPRRKDGSWLHEDPLNGWGFEESNAWQTTFGLSHDIPTLAQLMGGGDSLCARLDRAHQLSTEYDFTRNYGFGYVCYSNEPGLSSAHVFAHAGQPWLSQYWVRRVQRQAYGTTSPLLGYGGEDEDQGQMGCMSALMAMGLFSLDGGAARKPMYDITSPVFDEVVITLDPNYYKGKTFRIITHNNSTDNCYIQRATLNGATHSSYQFTHDQLAGGGTLELWLGAQPNKQWGK